MAFFKQFPKVQYDFERNGVITNVVNIYRSVRPLKEFIDSTSAYTFYEIKNGERPDIVSQRLYDNPNYYWTFFIVNEALHDGLQTWPLSQEDLFTYIEREYEGYAITTNPTITRTSDGLLISHENSLAGKIYDFSIFFFVNCEVASKTLIDSKYSPKKSILKGKFKLDGKTSSKLPLTEYSLCCLTESTIE